MRKGFFTFLATMIFCLVAALPAAALQWRIELHSEPGDFVGQGQDYLFTPADGVIDIIRATGSVPGRVDTAFFRFLGFEPGVFAHMEWSTRMLDIPLVPGFYPNARRSPFAPPGHPGLDFGLNGRGCNTLTGEFTVHDAVFDLGPPTPQVIRFSVSFEQHCEGAVPALFGRFDFDAEAPSVPEPRTALLIATALLGSGIFAVRRHRSR